MGPPSSITVPRGKKRERSWKATQKEELRQALPKAAAAGTPSLEGKEAPESPKADWKYREARQPRGGRRRLDVARQAEYCSSRHKIRGSIPSHQYKLSVQLRGRGRWSRVPGQPELPSKILIQSTKERHLWTERRSYKCLAWHMRTQVKKYNF